MSQQDMEKLLDRYLSGEASASEKERVEQWLANTNNPSAEWHQMAAADRTQWLSFLYSSIRQDIDNKGAKVVPIKRSKILWRSIAAVAAVLIIFFSVYLIQSATNNDDAVVEQTVLKTGINQKQQLTLADGSKVWVNAGSELTYPKTFDGKTREVYLSGEAYFDINHDVTRPFLIHTGKVITTVLGTAFNIKEDKVSHTIVVTVTRGKVSVGNGNKTLGILTPNQQISYRTDSQTAVQAQVDVTQVIAWQQQEIHFEDISFANAATVLEKRFKVKISFSNEKVKKCQFTGTSLNGDNLNKILKVICAFNGATYKTNADGSINIDGPGCDQ
ncbi:FecR family protein [Mucilaginibacter dorajii]|uniref:FecR domain-containing protein n=1 Tax=Mucilaginibacter dorajii TaxID=692994 RepID=A0ABP7R1R0_9SPHI|nr:FecR family protein [Mucilaginibacter dorajii]MCS3732082.1 ferric-dicitrate binding protein FerR (iron transport regulator) [Mucilaginibacter dorajii]